MARRPVGPPEADGAPGAPRLGVLGGSFDPVHLAHLIMAEEARVQLGLARVLFVPAGLPYLKTSSGVAPIRHRLEMVRLAVSSNPYFEASSLDIDRPGPSYTVDLLDMLRRSLPAEQEIFFVVGWDSLASLRQWREPERILEMCWLVGVPRPGVPQPDLKELDRVIPGIAKRVIMLDRPALSISSTEVRERVGRGVSIRYLVPEAVEQYIVEHGLYRKAGMTVSQ